MLLLGSIRDNRCFWCSKACCYPSLNSCFISLRSSIHGLTETSLFVHIATSSACDIFLTADAAGRDMCSPIPSATCLRHLSTPLTLKVCTHTHKKTGATSPHATLDLCHETTSTSPAAKRHKSIKQTCQPATVATQYGINKAFSQSRCAQGAEGKLHLLLGRKLGY